MGGLAFLAGILMLTGAGASAMMDLGPHQKKKTWTGDYPNFSSLWVSDQERICKMVYKNGRPYWETCGVRRHGDLLPIGGFDIKKIEKEVGHETAYKLMRDWLILELGYYQDNDPIDEELMQKYCWSGDYMSPLIPLALGIREIFPRYAAQYFFRGNGECLGSVCHREVFKVEELVKHTKFCNQYYERLKEGTNAKYKLRKIKRIDDDDVMDVIAGMEMATYIRDRQTEFVAGNYPSINLEHTNGRDFIGEFVPESGIMDVDTDVDKEFEQYNDYVDYLSRRNKWCEINHKPDIEKAKELFENNRYLKWCEKKRDETLKALDGIDIEKHGLTQWDACQITKAVNTGIDYAPFERYAFSHYDEYYNFLWKERGISYCTMKQKKGSFQTTEVSQLEQIHKANFKEFCERVKKHTFFLDYLTCYYSELYQNTYDTDQKGYEAIYHPARRGFLLKETEPDEEFEARKEKTIKNGKLIEKAKANALSLYGFDNEKDLQDATKHANISLYTK